MNGLIHKVFHLVLIVSSLVVMPGSLVAQVYKIVDENGNVMYTDRAPSAGADPVELRPLSVIEAPDYSEPAAAVKPLAELPQGQDIPLKVLRRNYSDFTITSPLPEATFRGSDNIITTSWGTRYKLQPGMQVTVYLDGQEFEKTTLNVVSLGRLERGEHRVMAVLNDARNRRIASTGTVTFYLLQVNTNQATATPANSSG